MRMKKFIALMMVFAFVASVSTVSAASSAASSSSGGSSSGSTGDSAKNSSTATNADANNAPSADANNGGARVPVPPTGKITPESEIAPAPCIVNCTPKPVKDPAPTPVPCSRIACKPVSHSSGHGSTGTQIRAVNGIVIATVPAPLPFADGTLLRDIQTKRMYIVAGASVRPIRNMADLNIFKGRARADVAPSVINLYSLDTSKYNYFKNGSLVRDAGNHKVYVADKGRLRAVHSLNELKTTFKGKAIKNLDPKTIAAY